MHFALDGYLVMMICRARSLDELLTIVKTKSLLKANPSSDAPQEHSLDINVNIEPVKGEQQEQPQSSTLPPIKTINTKQQHDDDDDDDIIVDSAEVISFRDQVSMDRIELPAKGIHCVHKSIFDLATFLQLGESSHVWNCSICDRPLPFDDLIIDPVIHDILSKVDETVDKIILHPDGTFEQQGAVPLKNEIKSNTPKTVTPIVQSDETKQAPVTPPLYGSPLLAQDEEGGNLSPLLLLSEEGTTINVGSTVDDAIEID
ncbi:E3 SUMO-protein ligase [Acrasis kona]|uniref:E3 SUMO-protein ligase n=1 Tax=Acrasis kona TaxID=1008807 RepID=A0AAW2Z264_9EUKA